MAYRDFIGENRRSLAANKPFSVRPTTRPILAPRSAARGAFSYLVVAKRREPVGESQESLGIFQCLYLIDTKRTTAHNHRKLRPFATLIP